MGSCYVPPACMLLLTVAMGGCYVPPACMLLVTLQLIMIILGIINVKVWCGQFTNESVLLGVLK